MIIKGKKVVITGIEEEDLEILRDAINSDELEQFEIRAHFPVSYAEQKKWYGNLMNSNDFDRRFVIKIDGATVGYISITNMDFFNRSAWLGIKVFDPSNRNNGIGTDSIMAVTRYCFDYLNFHRLETSIIEDNYVSIHVFEKKCGWKKEGKKIDAVYKNGEYKDVLLFAIVKNGCD